MDCVVECVVDCVTDCVVECVVECVVDCVVVCVVGCVGDEFLSCLYALTPRATLSCECQSCDN